MTKKFKPKYKPGDLVRITCDVAAFGWGPVNKYDIATVAGYSGNILQLNHPEHQGWSCHEYEVEPFEAEAYAVEIDLEIPVPEIYASWGTTPRKKQGKVI